jgi:hypothetical protein
MKRYKHFRKYKLRLLMSEIYNFETYFKYENYHNKSRSNQRY